MKPTTTYFKLQKAFDHFNKELFDDELPQTMIVLRKKGRCLGYYHQDQWSERDQEGNIDEICLNPTTFNERTDTEILSTLAHEMVHQWQGVFGKPSRNGYHNIEWGSKMKVIGLHPSASGKAGGRETGQQMTHYIMENGNFDNAMTTLDVKISLVKHDQQKEKKKSKNKAKFQCPECACSAWGKEDLNLFCGDCKVSMEIQ